MRWEQITLVCLLLLLSMGKFVHAIGHPEALARRGSGSGQRSPSPSQRRSPSRGVHSSGSGPNLDLTLGRPGHSTASSGPNLDLTLGRPGSHAHSSPPPREHLAHRPIQSTHTYTHAHAVHAHQPATHAMLAAQSHSPVHSGSKRPAEASHDAHTHHAYDTTWPPPKKAREKIEWWKKAGGRPRWPSFPVNPVKIKAGPMGYHHMSGTSRQSPQQKITREKDDAQEHPSGHELYPSQKGGGPPGSPGSGSHAVSKRETETRRGLTV